jgi:hypothetical protein
VAAASVAGESQPAAFRGFHRHCEYRTTLHQGCIDIFKTASFRPEHRRFWRCGVEKPLYWESIQRQKSQRHPQAAVTRKQNTGVSPLAPLGRDDTSKLVRALKMTLQAGGALRDETSKAGARYHERQFKSWCALLEAWCEICRYTLKCGKAVVLAEVELRSPK